MISAYVRLIWIQIIDIACEINFGEKKKTERELVEKMLRWPANVDNKFGGGTNKQSNLAFLVKLNVIALTQ